MIDIDFLRKNIRTIPDFPREGIQFKDITPVLSSFELCREVVKSLAEPFRNEGIDFVAGIESRGFLFGVLLAQELKCGFTVIRKKGKLPAQTIEQKYDLEYGSAIIEMHADAIQPEQKVLIHDDLLATGGTACAAAELIKDLQGILAGFSFVVELDFLNGRTRLQPYCTNIVSLVNY
ncbi:MAG: adenine phosphoribosyltransferase [Salibacteraceae bacterium]